MASITLRSTKGSPLTNTEVDTNFSNINTEVGTKLTATLYTAADVLTKIKTVDGSGSGLDADTLDGLQSSSANTVSTIVARDASGGFSTGAIIGTSFTGSVTGNVTGNVTGTVTNGVVTTGSYSNPTWLAGLAGSKVTAIPNSSLTNSSITINGTVVSLGGSIDSRATANIWTAAQTFRDSLFSITDDVDTTKVLNLQLSGITTNTTRTLTIPNESGTIATTANISSATTPLSTSITTLDSSLSGLQTQVNALTTAKGYISFVPATGVAYVQRNLSVTKTGTGNFTITLDPSIRNGTVNYAPMVGAISKAHVIAPTYAPGLGGQSGVNEANGFGLDVYGVTIQNVTATNFVVKSNRNYNYNLADAGGNDWNLTNTFAAALYDPERITIVVF